MTGRRIAAALATAALAVATMVVAAPAGADHSWGSYHWARTSNPFTLQLGDNVSSKWDGHLVTASSDWSQSSVLDTTVVAGGTDPRKCRATSGRVEVCNARYGFNGWLGIAGISVSGSHITAAYVKLNDSYFDTATYNTPAWRQFVTCQEVGHAFGLDHQDEAFDNPNLGTCMDYTNDPSPNQHPNAHDYAQLEAIYSHTDSTSTVGTGGGGGGKGRGNNADSGNDDWGRAVHHDGKGRPDVFVRNTPDGQVVTHVLWAG